MGIVATQPICAFCEKEAVGRFGADLVCKEHRPPDWDKYPEIRVKIIPDGGA